MLKLNLGSGQHAVEGYLSVDKFDSFSPDVVCDLEVTPWPFETSSVDEIILQHVLEHLGADVSVFFAVMKEMYRVCAPNAIIHLVVPHPRSDSYVNDPTHVRPITAQLMTLFSKKLNYEWREKNWANSPLGIYIDVDFEIVNSNHILSEHWREKFYSGEMNEEEINFAAQTYFNVVQEIQMDLRVIKQTTL